MDPRNSRFLYIYAGRSKVVFFNGWLEEAIVRRVGPSISPHYFAQNRSICGDWRIMKSALNLVKSVSKIVSYIPEPDLSHSFIFVSEPRQC